MRQNRIAIIIGLFLLFLATPVGVFAQEHGQGHGAPLITVTLPVGSDASPSPSPVNTPSPSATPTPSATPAASASPSPSATPMPTATPTETPVPTSTPVAIGGETDATSTPSPTPIPTPLLVTPAPEPIIATPKPVAQIAKTPPTPPAKPAVPVVEKLKPPLLTIAHSITRPIYTKSGFSTQVSAILYTISFCLFAVGLVLIRPQFLVTLWQRFRQSQPRPDYAQHTS